MSAFRGESIDGDADRARVGLGVGRPTASIVFEARMRPLFGIGELSRRCGIPASTIRTWQHQGLSLGARTDGGHRRFDDHDVERLDRFVRLLQSGGLTVRGAISAANAGESPRQRA